MPHLFSQPCCVVGQRQIRHRTHGSDDLTEGEEEDQAKAPRLHLRKQPTVHSMIACLNAESAVKPQNRTEVGLSFDRSFGETADSGASAGRRSESGNHDPDNRDEWEPV